MSTHTHTLSLSLVYRLLSLSLSHTYSFCTLTHSPSQALDLSRLRHSLRSIAYRFIEKSNITKFDHVHGQKQLHLERQTYTIGFTMRCSLVWYIFDTVDINNNCVNLIKVSKVWLLKKLHGTALSSGWNISFPLSAIWRTTQPYRGSSFSLKLYISLVHTYTCLARAT